MLPVVERRELGYSSVEYIEVAAQHSVIAGLLGQPWRCYLRKKSGKKMDNGLW